MYNIHIQETEKDMNKEERHTKSVVDSWEEWICNDSLGLGETPAEFVASAEELISRLEAHVDSTKKGI